MAARFREPDIQARRRARQPPRQAARLDVTAIPTPRPLISSPTYGTRALDVFQAVLTAVIEAVIRSHLR
jgi:hypothetical protein